MEVNHLSDIAHGRSGDKGNPANIAVIAYTPAGFAWLRQSRTAEGFQQFRLHKQVRIRLIPLRLESYNREK